MESPTETARDPVGDPRLLPDAPGSQRSSENAVMAGGSPVGPPAARAQVLARGPVNPILFNCQRQSKTPDALRGAVLPARGGSAARRLRDTSESCQGCRSLSPGHKGCEKARSSADNC